MATNKRFLKLVRDPLFGLAVGILSAISGFVFYYQGKSDAIAEERAKGYDAGLAAARKDSDAAFEKVKFDLLEKRYPGILQTAKDAAFAEGREFGRKEGTETGYKNGNADGQRAGLLRGHEVGYVEGQRKGREDAAAEYRAKNRAEKLWQGYLVRIQNLAAAIEIYESNKNAESQQEMLQNVDIVVNAAREIRSAYTNQASAFNGIMTNIEKALAVKSVPEVATLSKLLISNIQIKETLFLEASQKVDAAFERLDPLIMQLSK